MRRIRKSYRTILALALLALFCILIVFLMGLKPSRNKSESLSMINKLLEEGKENLDRHAYDQALLQYEESLELSQRMKYEKEIGKSLYGLGTVHRLKGSNPLAKEYYTKAVEVYSGLNDSVGIAETMNAMALVLTNTGEYTEALNMLLQSLKTLRRNKAQEEESSVLLNIGRLYTVTNDLENALEYTSQSLDLKRKLNIPGGIANALNNMGVIYRRKGEQDKALTMFEESLSIQRTLGDKTGVANSLNNIGIILHTTGHNEKAIRYFREALSIREELGDKSGIAMGLYNLGYMYSVIENHSMAFSYFKRSIDYSYEIKDNNYRLRGYEALSGLFEKTGDYKSSLAYFQQFKQLNDSLFNEKSKNQMLEIQVRYETAEKEQELARTRQISIALGALLITALAFFLAVFLLLSKRKKINRKLDQQNKEIIKQSKKLAEAKDLLSQNLKLKELFFAAANHELRVPLNIIKGFSELLENRIDDQQLLRYIEGIKNNIKSLQKLVDDILDFSMIESGNLRLEKGPVNLLHVAKDVYDIYHEQLKGRPVQLKVSKSRNLDKWLLLDEVRIRQIIYNLMENALKFTGQGDIHLNLEIKENPGSGYYDLIIISEDTGVGIPEEYKHLVLHTSFKTKPVIESHSLGYGLGLQIINRLVKCMNGKIKLESSSDKGTRFEIEIPGVESCDSSVVHKPVTLPANDFAAPGADLLIVDDSELNRRLLAMMLKENGFETREAEDGADALRAISVQKPELILMDLYMPNIDGYKALRKLKRSKSTSSIPVIAVTASASDEERENVYAAGFDAYITKPVDKKLLLTEIHQLIRKNLSFKS